MTTARKIKNPAKDVHHIEDAARRNKEESIKAIKLVSGVGIALIVIGFIMVAASLESYEIGVFSLQVAFPLTIIGLLLAAIGVFFVVKAEKYAKKNKIKIYECM